MILSGGGGAGEQALVEGVSAGKRWQSAGKWVALFSHTELLGSQVGDI